MQSIYPSEKVYVNNSQTSGAGRGVFAKRDIKKGEIIETCPVIEVSANDTSAMSESILLTYFFFHGKHKESIWLALGFGSLYNHSIQPNSAYQIKESDGIIEFSAIEDISVDTEITFDYKSGNPKNTYPLWFEAR